MPAELEKIILRCLRKDPERRAQHMDDVKVALQELKEESESGKVVPAVPRPRSKVLRYTVGAALVVLAGAAAFWFLTHSLQRDDAAVYLLRPITEGNYNYKPFWSPDGKLLYYYASKDGQNCLYARRLDASTKRPMGEELAIFHFHGDLRAAGGTVVGYGLTADRLYLPLQESKSSVWLAEPEGASLR